MAKQIKTSTAKQDRSGKDEIHKAHDLLRDAIESLSEGFALYDEDRRLVLFNKQYVEMNHAVADLIEPGLDWEILMRESVRRGIHTAAMGREDEWVSDHLGLGVEYIQNHELNHTDGSCHLASVHPTKLGGFVVTRTDITEKKKAEAAQRDGELLMRTVLDASAAAVIMARVGDGQILYRSPAALELFGNTKTAKEHYVSPSDRADYITHMLADGQIDDYQLPLVNAKGELFQASISGRVSEYKGEEVIVTSITDLTEKIETEALIRQVLEACPVPIQMTKVSTGEVLFSSPVTTALFGPVDSSKSYYADPNERDRYLEKLREKGWINDYRAEFTNADGEKFWGAVSSRLIEFQGEEVIVSNTRDLTDQLALQDELESQRELLFQNEKMSALGELLAGVAHELNNPLSIVVGHSLMLREEAKDPDKIRRIEKISGAAERCAKIVKTFLAMARQQPTKMETTDINAVIKTAVDVAGYGGTVEDVKILCDLNASVPNIVADSDQITQVIINLIINAEQAIAQAGTGDNILVSTDIDKTAKTVEILVTDNGPGIPDKIKARIFEPFFTTKDVGEGTGIGLAFCHRIILSHGGQIRLDPDHAPGSRFVISLPVADTADKDIPDRVNKSATKPDIKILVVDDEVDVAELACEILQKDGFEVDLAHSGTDAIDRLRETQYDILLSDLNMPEMDGGKLYEAIKCDFPHMADRTAFITGDTMGTLSQSLLRTTKRPYLEKPVSPAELRTLVHDLLNEKEVKI